jgi:hypothetical protein
MPSPIVRASDGTTEVTLYTLTTVGINTGVVKVPGNLPSSALLDNVIFAPGPEESFGSRVYENEGEVQRARDFAPWSFQRAGDYVIRRVSKTLGGVANTTLWSGGSNHGLRRSIHKTETYRSTFLTSLSWARSASNDLPTYTSVYSNLDTTFFSQTAGAVASNPDNAANPTDNVPGELTYNTSSPNPTNDDYQPKQTS